MARAKKDGQHINLFIDREVYEKLSRYADEKGQTKTMAMERILAQYLEQYNGSAEVNLKGATNDTAGK